MQQNPYPCLLRYCLSLGLMCFGLLNGPFGYSRGYYVSPSGNDQGPGSKSQPWKSLAYACTMVPAGQNHTIILLEGTFVESGQCLLPEGVSLLGQGRGKTILKGNAALWSYGFEGYQFEKYLILAKGGRQRISGFTLDGNGKKLHGGILVQDAEGVQVDNIELKHIFFNGIWFWNVQDVTFHESHISDCSWGSSAWAGGAVQLGAAKNVALCDLDIQEGEQRKGNRGGGLGIKVLGPEGHAVENILIKGCEVKVADFGLWQDNKAPNISIEFHNVRVKNCEIRDCTLNNTLSLVAEAGEATAGNMQVVQNRIICSGPASYPVELSMDHVELHHNVLIPGNGGYVMVNWEDKGVQYQDWNLHHNTIGSVSAGWPSSVVCSRGGLKNLKFTENKITLSGPPTALVALYGPNGSSRISITNNHISRVGKTRMETEPKQDWMVWARQTEGVHRVKEVEIRGNQLAGFPDIVSSYVNVLSQ